MSESEVDADSGLGGRLFTRGVPFGGSGNASMLVVLRMVRGVGRPDDGGDVDGVGEASVVLSVGTAGVERDFMGVAVGRPELVTDRLSGLDAGVVIAALAEPRLGSEISGMSGSAFPVLATGSAGSGPEGGASGEVDGRRAPEEAMVTVADTDIGVFRTRKGL